MWRWCAVLVAGVALVLLPRCVSASSDQRSVIVLLVDTLRADFIGCYGFDGDVSPNLDRFCAQSVRFSTCFSQAPWTKPSIATLFTSLDPQVHQVVTHNGQYNSPDDPPSKERHTRTDVLPDELDTIAEAFQQAGYATAAFVANPWIRTGVGFAQGFGTFEDKFAANATTAEVVIEGAIDWLKHRPREKPFFLYMHFMDVHDPYVAPESDFAAVKDAPGLGKDRKLTKAQLSPGMMRTLRMSQFGSAWAKDDQPDRLQLRTWRGRYAAGVHAFDRRLQTLFDYLGDSNLDRSTVVALTADHGEELFEHGGWAHGMKLYDDQLHVPLIVRTPEQGMSGRTVDGLMGLIDVAPTLLEYAGVAVPAGMKGKSQADALRGKVKRIKREAVFASAVKWEPKMRSVRTDRYKLIDSSPDVATLVFDVTKDPTEQRPLKGADDVTSKLRGLLASHRKATSAAPKAKPGKAKVDKATQERLRALGY